MAHAAFCSSVVRTVVPLLILIIQIQKLQGIWIRPVQVTENIHYMMTIVGGIQSQKQSEASIYYSLHGKGASQPPIKFTIDPKTGNIKANGMLDREETALYTLTGVAMFSNGTRAEADVTLNIAVKDINDCPPVFSESEAVEVSEANAPNTYVMALIATDADEPNTDHSQIAYSIVGGSGVFYINQKGELYLRQRIDRETQDTYTLTIKGTDMNGRPEGLSGTGKVVVKVLDVNDNVPTLEKNHYKAKVMENTFNVTVLRIKALDADLIHTDNWLAVFTIVSGNEAGYFSITTDTKTNEGILVLNKAINYEVLKELKLQVTVSNKAAYHSSTIITETKAYPITIHVQNEPEGPCFKPPVKVVHVSEDITIVDLKKVITTYKAIDSDTLQPAINVIYAKGEDRDNWITIDQTTAEIRLNKLPDRESKYLVNGTYYAKIICISKDSTEKTATGTIAIQVKDLNDNCPTLTSTSQTVCFQDNVVYATAVDRDAYPNGAPFLFKVGSNTKQQWSVEPLNDTTVILRPKETLWPGIHKVFMTIEDQQGKACAGGQVLDLEVCSCAKGQGIKTCLPREERGPTATLGPAGILLLLLGLLMLLLLPLLLLFCLCGAEDFKAIPWEAKQGIIHYNTEAPGEDKEVPVLIPVSTVDIGSVKCAGESKIASLVLGGSSSSQFSESNRNRGCIYPLYQVDTVCEGWNEQPYHEQRPWSGKMGAFEGTGLSEKFLEEYNLQKAHQNFKSCNLQTGAILESQELLSPKQGLVVYKYEGQGSPAGSVSCCSLPQDDQDLEFLNDLGPKFKTLANICSGAISEVESSNVTVTVPQPSTSHVTNTDISESISRSISAAKTQATNLAISSSLIQDSITSATRPATANMHLQENIVVPTQTLLIQQPTLYYAAAPPVYVVDPQPHPTLFVGPTVGGGENLVMVERKATIGGSAQAVVGMENLQGAQSLVLVEGRATGAGDPQQIIGTLGKRQVVMVEMQKGMGSGSVKEIGQAATLTCGNMSLPETTAVTAGSGWLQQEGSGGFIQVVPSQSHAGQSAEVRGQSASLNVPLQTVHESTQQMVVQETVSVTERHMQSSSTA